jgi:hypothetical protein
MVNFIKIATVKVTFYIVLVLLAISYNGDALSGEIIIKQEKQGVWILERTINKNINEERKIFFYRSHGSSASDKDKDRNHYLHPLMAPDGKTVLTEDSPSDHLHHRGVFWAWHEIAINNQKVADGWLLQDIKWQLKSLEFNKVDNQLLLNVHWLTGKDKKATISEQTIITISPLINGKQQLDFDINLTALVAGVSLAGLQKLKGYGGFSVRFKHAEHLSFNSTIGKIKPSKLQLTAPAPLKLAWPTLANMPTVAISCQAQGKLIEQWIFRNSTSMQNCVWPGTEPVSLSRSNSINLQATLMITQ